MDQDPIKRKMPCREEKLRDPTSVGFIVDLNRLKILEPNPMFLYKGAWFRLLREPFRTHAVTSALSLWIHP